MWCDVRDDKMGAKMCKFMCMCKRDGTKAQDVRHGKDYHARRSAKLATLFSLLVFHRNHHFAAENIGSLFFDKIPLLVDPLLVVLAFFCIHQEKRNFRN